MVSTKFIKLSFFKQKKTPSELVAGGFGAWETKGRTKVATVTAPTKQPNANDTIATMMNHGNI
ncbi:MAG TPA: hypothetical protein VJC13_00045 [Candidatus Paceibacterota bacterium]